jgi:methyl-accepting chemotaxis protein
MKLYTKLILSLACGFLAVMAIAQGLQYTAVTRRIADFAESNLQLFKAREELSAKNIFQSIEQAVAGSLERGEMEKFTRILEQQRSVDGLLEFSLLDREGIVTHSSDSRFLKHTLPVQVKTALLSEMKQDLQWTEDAVAIYKPLVSNNDCVRCHTTWRPGEVGGILHFRFSKAALTKARSDAADILASMKSTTLKNALITLVVVVLVLIAAIHFLVSRFVSKPLGRITTRFQDIAEGEGDLTARINLVGHDEIGTLAVSFNTFIEKLQVMVRHIQKDAQVLHNSSNSLTQLSSNMSEEAGHMSAQSSAAAATISHMNGNMTSAAATMESSSSNVGSVATATEHMNANIDAIVNSTTEAHQISKNAVNQTRNAKSMMEELGQAAREIGTVTETITDISEQTNLLALNATIEAARAGEAGKGFVVVANEIKELARQTAESTKEIKERNDGIQSSAQRTMKEIESVAAIIDSVNELVSSIAASIEEQSSVTHKITRNINKASEGIVNASDNVKQSSEMSATVVDEISSVHHAVENMANSNQRVKQSADESAALAKQLKDMVDRFITG